MKLKRNREFMFICGSGVWLAACYFELEASYSELSGLTVAALVGESGGQSQEFPVSLNFDHPESFLFSSVLNRFEFQPSFQFVGSLAPLNPFIVTRCNWHGQWIRADLKLGRETFNQHPFALVTSQLNAHAQFQEVGGIVSFTQSPAQAPNLMRNRILGLKYDAVSSRVKITSFGPQGFLPWTFHHSVVSISAEPTPDSQRYTRDFGWSFLATQVALGGTRLGRNFHVQVDPSCSDIVVPTSLMNAFLAHSQNLGVHRDSGRLYVLATTVFEEELAIEFRTGGKVVKISAESLRFPLEFSIANQRSIPGHDGPMIPLRLCFFGRTLSIKIGRPLLESYLSIYLDNVNSPRILLVPKRNSIFTLPRPHSALMVENIESSALILEDVFEDFSVESESAITELFFPATNALEEGLVPWRFRERIIANGDGLSLFKRYELQLIRRCRKPADFLESSSLFILSSNVADVQLVANIAQGISLRFDFEAVEDRFRYSRVVVYKLRDAVILLISQMAIRVEVPPPFLLETARISSDEEESLCGICTDAMESGQMIQRVSPCDHKFHADCIYQWLYRDKTSCPTCRASIPLVSTGPQAHFV